MPRSARAAVRSGARCSPKAWSSARPAPGSACCWREPLVTVAGRYAARFSVRALEATVDASVLWLGAGLARDGRRAARLRPAAPVLRSVGRFRAGWRQRADHAGHEPPPADLCDDADRVLVRAARRRRHAGRHADGAADGEHRLRHATGPGDRRARRRRRASATRRGRPSSRKPLGGSESCRACRVSRPEWSCPGATRSDGLKFQFAVEGYQPANGEENPTCRFRPVSPGFFAVLGVPILAGRDFKDEDRQRQRAGRHRQPERGPAAVP